MKQLTKNQLRVVEALRDRCDNLAKGLLKDKEHAHIHDEAQNHDGNPDEDVVGLLYAASANLDQIIERQV
ncbi:hypothetical protein [Dysgonomonas termitidis]|uniref:Uncharacterized protein n=1 Tax=Dysgonomonas termitidis TaxID=1516126 RepID=A0ABV9KS81_9BACT